MALEFDRTWIWHPDFNETETGTAGRLVHFRRVIDIDGEPPSSLKLHITADTRYKLYANYQLVGFGPVKGDQNLWFYDEVDVGPFLQAGENIIGVHVLRFFHATAYAPSFPRLPTGGLRILVVDSSDPLSEPLETSALWEAAIDWHTVLRVDQDEDDFLHIYEITVPDEEPPVWVPAKVLDYKVSTGNSTPWNLSPRLIPAMKTEHSRISSIRNVHSTLNVEDWKTIFGLAPVDERHCGLLLPAGTRHSLELQAEHHSTAFIRIRFKRPATGGSILKVKYSESYEDEPESTPWVRRKGDRLDYLKRLFGPEDIYHFQGPLSAESPRYVAGDSSEIFMPYHFRTFRFIGLDISVHPSCDLVLESFEIERTAYPLKQHARVKANEESEDLWTTSIRTLQNCMHDCYEDCPFYEQLQYAMDSRSSALFTYCVSGDDRLARQAIIQIHSSFNARVGLTKSRAPTHRAQFIPTFSLYWVCMISDHLLYFNDKEFVSQFLPVIDAVLWYFHSRIDKQNGLSTSELRPGIWNYVDWTPQWTPHGIPPAILRTGVSTFTNQLYAYTLSQAAQLVSALGRHALAGEYTQRANNIIHALQTHCFTGTFFSDTINSQTNPTADFSQHCQVWAVLCGAIAGEDAQKLLRSSFQQQQAHAAYSTSTNGGFTQESVSMSFYTLRALSLAGGDLYDAHFHRFWAPWRRQLAQNVDTWVEDHVSQRSDCHAWGSVPIYEFIAEVAGVRPADPGWRVIEIRPRIALYRELEATVPLRAVDGEVIGLVHVSWRRMDGGETRVEVRVDGEAAACHSACSHVMR
ncbi:Six-hairpin glycosidase [Aspergillus granulosus]|uniref:Six-hairpin glycosidase n=1 Tax=Aspergillus granulosus TaxID=176169 RepID=A0ABR4GU30_9EURO